MEGHAFLGPDARPRQYAFSFRNRMDERYDFVRTARDARYRYIRNYNPHLPWGQHVSYMFQQRSVQVWHDLYKQGKLAGPRKTFWEEKPAEELFDIQADPHEVNNLADNPQHRQVLERMRAALRDHMLRTRDNGFIPEGSSLEGYDAAHDDKAYPLQRIMELADVVTQRDPANLSKFIPLMTTDNECIRYWATMGCLMLRDKASPAAEALYKRLADESGSIRVVAAETLAYIGQDKKGVDALTNILASHKNPWVRLQAINALHNLGDKARPSLFTIEKAIEDENNYVQRAAKTAAALLKGESPQAG
jgi:hypothetical protein